ELDRSNLPSPLERPTPLSIALPTELFLSNAFPNPANGAVAFALALPKDDDVALSILDVQGREVWGAPAQRYNAGRWSLAWDGRTARGTTDPGVYFARVRVGALQFLRRIA